MRSSKYHSIREMIYTSYIKEEDITIVWQGLYDGEEPVQRTIVGWYYGAPDERFTKEYSRMPLAARFF